MRTKKKKSGTHQPVWEQGEVGTGQDAGKRDLGKKQVVRKENEGGRGLTSRGPGWDAEKKYAEGNPPTRYCSGHRRKADESHSQGEKKSKP